MTPARNGGHRHSLTEVHLNTLGIVIWQTPQIGTNIKGQGQENNISCKLWIDCFLDGALPSRSLAKISSICML